MTTKEANEVIERLTGVSVTLADLSTRLEVGLEKTNSMMQTMLAVIQKSATIAMIMRNDLEKQRDVYRKQLDDERKYYRGRVDEMIKQKNVVQEQNDKLVDFQLRVDKYLDSAFRHGENKNTTNVKIGDAIHE